MNEKPTAVIAFEHIGRIESEAREYIDSGAWHTHEQKICSTETVLAAADYLRNLARDHERQRKALQRIKAARAFSPGEPVMFDDYPAIVISTTAQNVIVRMWMAPNPKTKPHACERMVSPKSVRPVTGEQQLHDWTMRMRQCGHTQWPEFTPRGGARMERTI